MLCRTLIKWVVLLLAISFPGAIFSVSVLIRTESDGIRIVTVTSKNDFTSTEQLFVLAQGVSLPEALIKTRQKITMMKGPFYLRLSEGVVARPTDWVEITHWIRDISLSSYSALVGLELVNTPLEAIALTTVLNANPNITHLALLGVGTENYFPNDIPRSIKTILIEIPSYKISKFTADFSHQGVEKMTFLTQVKLMHGYANLFQTMRSVADNYWVDGSDSGIKDSATWSVIDPFAEDVLTINKTPKGSQIIASGKIGTALLENTTGTIPSNSIQSIQFNLINTPSLRQVGVVVNGLAMRGISFKITGNQPVLELPGIKIEKTYDSIVRPITYTAYNADTGLLSMGSILTKQLTNHAFGNVERNRSFLVNIAATPEVRQMNFAADTVADIEEIRDTPSLDFISDSKSINAIMKDGNTVNFVKQDNGNVATVMYTPNVDPLLYTK